MAAPWCERGFIVAGARILKRAWQIYVAHVFLFAIYIAEIAYVASSFDNPLYAEEMNALDFLKQPGRHDHPGAAAQVQAGQHGRAAALHRAADGVPAGALAADPQRFDRACGFRSRSTSLTWEFGWNIAVLSERPLVLQSVRLAASVRVRRLVRARRRDAAGAGVALAASRSGSRSLIWCSRFGVTLTWYFPRLSFLIPHWLGEWMYPIDKTNLDVLRFAHFLALAALTVRFIPRDWPVLQSRWLRPAILCGQHSLEIFCLGVFLAFAAHFVMVEFYGGTAMQVLMSMAGILIMIGTALADLVVQTGRRPRLGNARSGRRMPTLPEARHEEVDRPGASGR